MSTDADARRLDEIERRLQDAERRRRAGELKRRLARTGDVDEAFEAAIDADEAAALADPGYGAFLADRVVEPRGQRHRRRWAAAVIRTDAAIARSTRELAARAAAFEPWVDDRPASWPRVAEVLRRDPDRAHREAAWFAAVPLAVSIEPDVQQLMVRRNARARALDADGFPEAALPADELSVLEFLTMSDELEPLTRPIFEQMLAWMRRENEGATLEPWDIEFFLARLEPPADAFAGGERAARIEDLTRRLCLEPSAPGIRLHGADDAAMAHADGVAAVIPVVIPAEIHAFLGRRDGATALADDLHAWGHALHLARLPAGPPWRHWTSGGFDEAMAALIEQAGMAAAFVARGAVETDTIWRSWRAVWDVRRLLAASLFEVLAYENPESDLHGLWCEIHEHYLGFPRHPERLWATEAGFVTRPLAGPGVILGRLMAAQLAEALTERHGGVLTAGAGAALRESLWSPGAGETAEVPVERLTGRIPDPDAWVRTVSTEMAG